jgi:hypothetical protein
MNEWVISWFIGYASLPSTALLGLTGRSAIRLGHAHQASVAPRRSRHET